MQVMAVCDESTWEELERIFIEGDPPLTNMTPGGEGVPPEIVSASRSGTYIVTHPDGTEETVTNLSAFCAEKGIPNGNAFKVLAGKRHKVHGYRFRYVGEPPREPYRFIATFPDGSEEKYFSHKEWAESHGFNPQSIRAVACGQKPHYKGIKIRRAEEMVDS